MVQNIQQKLPGESPLRQPAVVLSREPWTQQNVPIGKAFKKEQIRVGRDHCQTRVYINLDSALGCIAWPHQCICSLYVAWTPFYHRLGSLFPSLEFGQRLLRIPVHEYSKMMLTSSKASSGDRFFWDLSHNTCSWTQPVLPGPHEKATGTRRRDG